MTFVVTSHDMQVIEDICDRVIILDDGDIIADDDVQHLLDLFDNQSYRITLDRELERATRDRFDQRYTIDDWDVRQTETLFTVTVTENEFYELIADIERMDASLRDLQSIDPNLETVFLEVLNEENRVVP